MYDYVDPAQPGIPHTVKAVDHPTGTTDAVYLYDNNGNMTCREEEVEGTHGTWKQTYNEENRLWKIEKISGTCASQGSAALRWTNTYDGDGVRVQQDYWNGSTTTTTLYFMGGMYEIQDSGGGEKTLVYYNIRGVMVAMDDGTDLVYFASDQLSSASLVMDDSGTLLSENRYMPFGEVRTISGVTNITETDFGYTRQRNNTYIKLLDYKARSYSLYLNRFIQPDPIILNYKNPQTLNRYSYTLNNPVKYNDPSGHVPEGACGFGGGDCEKPPRPKPDVTPIPDPGEVPPPTEEDSSKNVITTFTNIFTANFTGGFTMPEKPPKYLYFFMKPQNQQDIINNTTSNFLWYRYNWNQPNIIVSSIVGIDLIAKYAVLLHLGNTLEYEDLPQNVIIGIEQHYSDQGIGMVTDSITVTNLSLNTMNVVGNVSYLIADAEKIITIDNLFYFSHIHPGESKTSNLGFTSFLSPTFFIQFFGVDPAALYHYGNTKFTSPVLAP